MLGSIMVFIGSLFEEISDSIGKRKVNDREESLYAMGFLTLFWGVIFFALVSWLKKDGFVFAAASLPTFLVRAFLEIIQSVVSLAAIVKADRSTFSFVRVLTIPLLLLVDLFLGYQIGYLPVLGMTVVIAAFLIIIAHKGIRKQGVGLVIFSAVNAVATLSLFKYNITHFNSIAAEQMLSNLVLLLFFAFIIIFKAKENPLALLKRPAFFLQSVSMGLAGVIISFGYNYAPASVITAIKRSSAVFWSLVSGKLYFREKNLLLKAAIFVLLAAGLVLLSL